MVRSGWTVIARGNLSTPFWSAESPDGLVTLGRANVPASDLGSSTRAEGTVSVPVSLVLASSGKAFFRAPKGWAILDVAASSSGVLLTEGPVHELGATALNATDWHLVSIPWFGKPRIDLSSAKRGGRTGITDLAVTGDYWGALVLYTPNTGRVPSAAFLAEGDYDRPQEMHIHYTAGGYLPTSLAFTPRGQAVVGALAYFGSGVGEVAFPSDAGVLAEWSGSGALVPGPGGVYAVTAHEVRRVESDKVGPVVARFPSTENIAWVAGSAATLVTVLERHGGGLRLWSLGTRPRGLDLAGISGLDGITVTGNGVSVVAISFARRGLVLEARGWPMA